MKIRSLLLGSIAAAGLSTGAFAADLGVLTSLDVCDQLGLSGLTISSETNCLQITGGVDYRFRTGDYRGLRSIASTYDGTFDDIGANSFVGDDDDDGDDADNDYETRSRAFLQAVATSNTDFGPAAAVLGIRQIDEIRYINEGLSGFSNVDSSNGPVIDEAYVRVGDSTVLMAGKRRHGTAGSVANIGDDASYSFLFMQDNINGGGILIDANDRRLGNQSLQVTTDLGNGISASAALEDIDGQTGDGDRILDTRRVEDLALYDANAAGTAIGVLQYAGEGVTAHATGIAYGVLDGDVESYAFHAGATGTFDNIAVRAAVAYDSNFKNVAQGFGAAAGTAQGFAVLTGVLTAQATFDIFKLAASGEFASFDDATDYDVSGNIGVNVTDGVSLNLLGLYFRDNHNDLDTARVQGSLGFAATETIGLTAAIGVDFGDGVGAGNGGDENIVFGSVGATWKPGGGVDTSVVFEANDTGAYRTTVAAGKSFN